MTARSEDPGRSRVDRRARLKGLYAIVGDTDPVARAEAVISGGARSVQVRMKKSPAGAVLDATRRIVALSRGRALVIVNDRPDLAILAGADGVHLGEDDLPVEEARELLGESLLIGRTARTADSALEAIEAGADYIGYGPIFPSKTKTIDVAPRGLEALAATCSAIPAPVVAISGITLENIAAVARTGAAAAAVIGALFDQGDPRAQAAALAKAFARSARPPTSSGRTP